MLKLRLFTFLSLAVVLTSSCTYAGKTDQEIVSQLYLLTPLGTPASEVLDIATAEFGESQMLSSASYESGQWIRSGWLLDNAEPPGEAFAYMYKLGGYPSEYIIFPTNIFGTWYFDVNHVLAHIEVTRETDAL